MSYKSAAAILFHKPHCIVSAIVREYSHNFQQYESHVELEMGSILKCFIQASKYYQDRKLCCFIYCFAQENFNLMNHHLQFFDHLYSLFLDCKRFYLAQSFYQSCFIKNRLTSLYNYIRYMNILRNTYITYTIYIIYYIILLHDIDILQQRCYNETHIYDSILQMKNVLVFISKKK